MGGYQNEYNGGGMIRVETKQDESGAYYALAYDGDTCLFKTAPFETEAAARKEAAEKLEESDLFF